MIEIKAMSERKPAPIRIAKFLGVVAGLPDKFTYKREGIIKAITEPQNPPKKEIINVISGKKLLLSK